MYVTPRTLLAIIRLSQALAKLSFREQVNQVDVDEAIKLMDFSIRSLRTLKAESQGSGERSKNRQNKDNRKEDRMSEVINAVRELFSNSNYSQMKIGDLQKALQKNRMSTVGQIDKEELTSILNHYKKLNILFIDQEENVLFL